MKIKVITPADDGLCIFFEVVKDWLDCVDGIFLNYGWNLKMLPTNDHRVFASVDAFGRHNTHLGGGMMSGAALHAALQRVGKKVFESVTI